MTGQSVYDAAFTVQPAQLEQALEGLVDGNDLPMVLEALARVCFEKAEHTQGTWNDRPLSETWNWAGRRLDTLADNRVLGPLVYKRGK